MMQKTLSKEITTIVHSDEAYENALKASNILFSNNFKEDIEAIDESIFLEIFEGVPQYEIEPSIINKGLDMISALSNTTNFSFSIETIFASNSLKAFLALNSL